MAFDIASLMQSGLPLDQVAQEARHADLSGNTCMYKYCLAQEAIERCAASAWQARRSAANYLLLQTLPTWINEMQKLHTRTTAGLQMMLKTVTLSLAVATYLERSLYPERKIRVVDLVVGKAWLADSCQLNQRWGSNLLFLACRAKQHRAPASPRFAVSIALVLVLPKGPGACLFFASLVMVMCPPAFYGTVGSRLYLSHQGSMS